MCLFSLRAPLGDDGAASERAFRCRSGAAPPAWAPSRRCPERRPPDAPAAQARLCAPSRGSRGAPAPALRSPCRAELGGDGLAGNSALHARPRLLARRPAPRPAKGWARGAASASGVPAAGVPSHRLPCPSLLTRGPSRTCVCTFRRRHFKTVSPEIRTEPLSRLSATGPKRVCS